MSLKPLLNKKADTSLLLFLLPYRRAEVPDKNTNTGAQKLVIYRVKNNMGMAVCKLVGSELIWKKSRVWSGAIMIITNTRRISIELILIFL